MKREGRQHGMVETYRFVQSRVRARNSAQSEPAAPFTRVSQKPTNHSKFTGKCSRPRCAGCHTHPVEKSRYKAKGTQKLKCSDVLTNHKLVKWRVVDSRLAPGPPGLKLTGSSATEILDHLANDDYYLDEIEDDGDGGDHLGYGYDADPVYDYGFDYGLEGFEGELADDQGEGADVEIDGDDDRMSFCDVGFIWEDVDGEDGGEWYLVEEI
ncbi:OLC1v1011764C1 [Oldenlandia corymbosa var. corymbosa]|uniref:OLC1v1011764C1 n=1 Tax=Oldenlandia corymbosa var. corymbosa TaxID=529605 RepID=A0AAV1DUG7_OLDCO|nr:OLC1v1011764C1 [Oldenlandia corymbosa var. corymbosa]